MKVTVVIPVYNRAHLINRAVKSVLEQTLAPAEIIVVDDGSNDKPENALHQIQNKHVQIVKQEHQGVAAARNKGIETSKSGWIAFLDSDDYWLPSKLQKQIDFHDQNSNFLISHTDELWIKNDKKVNQKTYHIKPEGDIFELSLERCLVSPSTVMINRKIFNDTGSFDIKFPVCEDYDLWLRISSKYKVGLVNEKLVVKTGGHPDQLSYKYWGMDRFRVKSLEKLISADPLGSNQKKAALDILIKKLLILKTGAKKRGKLKEVKHYNELLNNYYALFNEPPEGALTDEI